MTRRFSPQELSFLRNRVPINRVIEKLFEIPTHSRDGKLSFACPMCGGYDTSVNAPHNLARCFTCQQNFNPIELVMHQLQIDFVDSVKWLQNRMASPRSRNTPIETKKKTQPAAISDVLADIMPVLSKRKIHTPAPEWITQRLAEVEKNLKNLHRMIKELRSSLEQ